MNTKLTLTAIAMFAVMMGLSMYSPAMAAKLDKSDICHFEESYEVWNDLNGNGEVDEGEVETIPAEWKIINVNDNSLSAHLGVHGDGVNVDQLIDDSETPAENTVSTEDCLARNTA